MTFWQGFWLGMMVAWTPSVLVFALLLRKAPDKDTPDDRRKRFHSVKNKG